jgi:hypothetical protein
MTKRYVRKYESAARVWARALREFSKLAGVDNDPSRINSVADLVFIAQFEIDLFNEGDSTLTPEEMKPIRKFVAKWDGYTP